MSNVDQRIGALCSTAGLHYTRYVDDLAISGNFDLEQGTIPQIVEGILYSAGFCTRHHKRATGRISEMTLTNLRMMRGRLDVTTEYLEKVETQLANAKRLVEGESIDGFFYTRAQVFGRILFISSIRPGRRRSLMRVFEKIDWGHAYNEAVHRGLLAPVVKLKPVAKTHR